MILILSSTFGTGAVRDTVSPHIYGETGVIHFLNVANTRGLLM